MKKKDFVWTALVVSGILLLSNIALVMNNREQAVAPSTYILPLTLGSTTANETLTVIRTCSLSPKYEIVPVLQAKKTLATDDELLVLAKKYGVISSSAKIRDFGGGDKVLFGNGKSFHTHGLDHFMLSYDDVTHLNNTISEESAKKVADEFVARLLKDNPDYPCTIEYDRTVIGSRRISTNPETGEKIETIHALKVNYDLYYDGIPIYGNGADVSVSVCNFRIVGLEVHLPKIFFKHKTSDYKTPDPGELHLAPAHLWWRREDHFQFEDVGVELLGPLHVLDVDLEVHRADPHRMLTIWHGSPRNPEITNVL